MNRPENNFFVTGPSRSGTSLACSILNESPDCIALNEAFRIDQLGKNAIKDNEYAFRSIQEFVSKSRKNLLETKSASSKGGYSMKTSDPAADSYSTNHRGLLTTLRDKLSGTKGLTDHGKLRQIVHRIGTTRFEKPLTDDFKLILKHNLLFTAILDLLNHDFPCFAIIRNPLSTIVSWNTVNFPLGKGILPDWFRYWHPKAYRLIMKERDLINRQINLLEWMFQQYEQLLPTDHILTYEEMIASGGTSLSKAMQLTPPSKLSLESRNQNALYPEEIIEKVEERLLKREGIIWSFYTKGHL